MQHMLFKAAMSYSLWTVHFHRLVLLLIRSCLAKLWQTSCQGRFIACGHHSRIRDLKAIPVVWISDVIFMHVSFLPNVCVLNLSEELKWLFLLAHMNVCYSLRVLPKHSQANGASWGCSLWSKVKHFVVCFLCCFSFAEVTFWLPHPTPVSLFQKLNFWFYFKRKKWKGKKSQMSSAFLKGMLHLPAGSESPLVKT